MQGLTQRKAAQRVADHCRWQRPDFPALVGGALSSESSENWTLMLVMV